MKEIGGYFELENLVKNSYYNNLIELNTARNALLYLIKAKRINKVYLPHYLCCSIKNVLQDNNKDYEFYHIDQNFEPIYNKTLNANEILLFVNYFGFFDTEKIMQVKKIFGNIVVDNTQAFFQIPLKGIDTIYSCRKFFGVPDGAYLSTDILIDETISVDKSYNRFTHLLGRYENSATEYFGYFKETNKSFANLELMTMSKLTQNLLGAIDYGKIIKKRTENFDYLNTRLGKFNKLSLTTPKGPFAYPLFIENGIEIRKELAQQKIYIPTLWPNVLIDCPKDSIEYNYAANILPLPCDQRYDLANMEKVVEEMFKCLKI